MRKLQKLEFNGNSEACVVVAPSEQPWSSYEKEFVVWSATFCWQECCFPLIAEERTTDSFDKWNKIRVMGPPPKSCPLFQTNYYLRSSSLTNKAVGQTWSSSPMDLFSIPVCAKWLVPELHGVLLFYLLTAILLHYIPPQITVSTTMIFGTLSSRSWSSKGTGRLFHMRSLLAGRK